MSHAPPLTRAAVGIDISPADGYPLAMFLRLIIALCVFPVLLSAASVDAPGVEYKATPGTDFKAIDAEKFMKDIEQHNVRMTAERERREEEQWFWFAKVSVALIVGAVAVVVTIRKQLKQSPPPTPAGAEKQAETDTEPKPPRTYDY